MDPWDDWNRKEGGDPFERFFEDFEAEFARMREMFDDVFRQMREAQAQPGQDPFVMGWTVRMGPDGRPQVEPFGNTRSVQVGTDPNAGGREPLTDVIGSEEEVAITVELPGVEKDHIKLRVKEDTVHLRVEGDQRRYRKDITLPGPVQPETAEATYKNGVLDVTIQRTEPDATGGHAVEVR